MRGRGGREKRKERERKRKEESGTEEIKDEKMGKREE